MPASSASSSPDAATAAGEMNSIIAEIGEAFNAVRAILFPDIWQLRFLKPSRTAREYELVGTIDSDWFFEYSDYRQAFVLQIADASGHFGGAWFADATHVEIGSDVFTISRMDTRPPQGADLTWKIFCTDAAHPSASARSRFRPLSA